MFKAIQIYMIVLLSWISLSCSGIQNPVTSGENENSTINPDSPGFIAESRSFQNDPYLNRNVFGAWKIHIDPENLQAEIIPARNAKAIGNIFDADLSQFLTVAPCETCLRITHIEFNHAEIEGNSLLIDFAMKHPFPNITKRPDLHGFDVRLILIADGSSNFFDDLSIIMPDGSTQPVDFGIEYVINADGYTSHYDWLPSDERYFMGGADVPGNLNPYIRFFDDPTDGPFDPQAPSGHNVMPVGSAEEIRSVLFGGQMFGGEGWDLYAVADVAYGQSAVFSNRSNPQYYLPAFNRTEAWRTEYWIENNNLSETDPTSTADVMVQVFDWQHSATVDPAYPNPANLSGIPESSRVASLQLCVPDLQTGMVEVTTPESGDGSPTNPLLYRMTVTNELGIGGYVEGLLAVRDELQGQASPHGRVPIPDQPSGFPYSTLDIRDYTHYNIIMINVPFANHPVLFNHELNFQSRDLYTESGNVDATITSIMDRSGMKFLYEWDYDYDGVTFNVDQSGSPEVRCSCAHAGINYLGLRFTTNSVPPRQYTYTIPIYNRGINFLEIPASSDPGYTTYQGQNHAMDVHDGIFYTAITYHGPGYQDIFLFIYDSNGIVGTQNVTTSIDDTVFNPSIEIVDDGPNAGIYVAYSVWDSGETDVYSTYGNLNLTGFGASETIPISNDPAENENEVNLIHHEGTLYAYYVTNDAVELNNIACSSQPLRGATWTNQGTVSNPPAGNQGLPSITYCAGLGQFFLAWQDDRDFATRGHDIYIAKSSDFTSFSDGVNLFPETGLFEEATPCISSSSSEIAVTYLTNDFVTTDINAFLLITDSSFTRRASLEIGSYLTPLKTIPAVSWVTDDNLILVYGLYDSGTQQLTARISEVSRSSGGFLMSEIDLLSRPAGTTPLASAFIFPGIASMKTCEDRATTNLVAYRTFELGRTDAVDPVMAFGNVQFVNVILKGEDY